MNEAQNTNLEHRMGGELKCLNSGIKGFMN
jgi:hypothetical protein